MKLIENAGSVLRYAWSVKFAILAAVLAGVDVTMQALSISMPSPWITAAAGFASAAAAFSRFIYQPKVSGDGSAAQE